MEYIFLVTGLILGVFLGIFIIKVKSKKSIPYDTFQTIENDLNQFKTDKTVLDLRVNEYSQQISELKNDLTKERNNNIVLSKSLSVKETEFSNLNEKLETQKKEISSLQEKFAIESIVILGPPLFNLTMSPALKSDMNISL